VADVQQLINEAVELNSDGVVNVVDIMIDISAYARLHCRTTGKKYPRSHACQQQFSTTRPR
jgi:hypothetical protein